MIVDHDQRGCIFANGLLEDFRHPHLGGIDVE
jgi:hypothetical protein